MHCIVVCLCNRDETVPLRDTVSDIAKDSSRAATNVGCGIETLAAGTAASFAETATSSGNCSSDGRRDGANALTSNCLNMDDIMEYLQCQDASLLENATQNASSVNASLSDNFASGGSNQVFSMSDNLTSSTLSLAALQQLASECSTIDLSSLGMDSSVPFVGSNGPASGK